MDYKLRSAGFVKKSFKNNSIQCRHQADGGHFGRRVADGLHGWKRIDAQVLLQPGDRGR